MLFKKKLVILQLKMVVLTNVNVTISNVIDAIVSLLL